MMTGRRGSTREKPVAVSLREEVRGKRRREEKVRRESPSFSFFPTPLREASAFYGPVRPRRK
jgi:hypothetical protein